MRIERVEPVETTSHAHNGRAASHVNAMSRGLIRLSPKAIYLIPIGALLGLIACARLAGQIDFANVRAYAFMDQYRYVAMAEHPFGSQALVREAPFCWRLLAPLLVHVLPVPTLTGFWLLTVLSLAGAALALLWFLRGLGLPPGAAVAGGVAFVALTYTTGFTLWDYMLVDPLAMALLVLAMAASVQRAGPLLVATLVALAITKETVLLAGVFSVIWAWEKHDARMLRWSVGGLIAGVVVLFAIHLAVTPSAPYDLIAQIRLWNGVRHNPPSYFLNRVFDALVDAWGILLPFAVLQVMHAPRIWRSPAFAVTLVGAFAQILVASDTQRLVIYAFPLVIAAVAFEVEYLAQRASMSRWWLWVPLLLIEFVWWFSTYGTWYRPVLSPLTHVTTMLTYWFVPVTIVVLAVAAGLRYRSASASGARHG